MTIAPDRLDELIREQAERDKERYFVALHELMEQGFAVLDLAGGVDELQAFLRGTFAEELDMVLDEDYIEKWRLGEYPPLMSPIWGPLLGLPSFVFDFFAGRFRTKLRAQLKRELVA